MIEAISAEDVCLDPAIIFKEKNVRRCFINNFVSN